MRICPFLFIITTVQQSESDFPCLGISWGAAGSFSKKRRLRASQMPVSPQGEKRFCSFSLWAWRRILLEPSLACHCAFGLLQPPVSTHTLQRRTATGTLRTVVYCSEIYFQSKNWDCAASVTLCVAETLRGGSDG